MQPELLCPTAPVRHQHANKCAQGRARMPIDDELGIVKEFAAALLKIVHERILFVWVQRFVEPAQFEEIGPARREVAENQFFLAGWPDRANPHIPGATGTESKPTGKDDSKDLLKERSFRRTKIRSTQHFDACIAKVRSGLLQVLGRRAGIIVEE